MIVWHLLAIVAIKMLASGRAAILGYTMPVWAVVFGLLLFKEKPLPRHWVGVTAAFVGTLLLLSSEFTKLAGSPLGTILMLVAAAAWGYGTHLMRRHLTAMPTIALTFWMLSLTLVVTTTVSIATEMDQWRMPLPLEWFSIVYNMAIAIAFCHVVWSMLARNLPPAASGAVGDDDPGARRVLRHGGARRAAALAGLRGARPHPGGAVDRAAAEPHDELTRAATKENGPPKRAV